MHGGGGRIPIVSLAPDDALLSKSAGREVISLSERSASGEGISTCRVSGSGHDMVRQMHGHIDLCGTDPGLLCAATQRHPNDIASWLLRCEAFSIKSFVTHE